MRWDRPQRPEEGDRPHETGVSDVPILHTPEDKKVRVPWSELYLSPEDEATGPEGTPPDRVRDVGRERPEEPGSWRGDGGQYLNHEENLVTDHAIDRIHTAEPQITDTLRTIGEDLPHADLVGLEYRLKGDDRFKEKVERQYYSKLDAEVEIWQIPDTIPDAVRYTYQVDAERYVQGYREVRERLEADGYTMFFSRNSWDSPDYKGVNTRWETPEGQRFEVQFHTAESFQAKQETHGLYERIRDPSTSREERRELELAQREVFRRVPVPDRVDEIRNHRMEGY